MNSGENSENGSMRDIYISEHNAALLERVTRKKQELDKRRPLTQGELERLQEDFLVDFTYNSNAIEGGVSEFGKNRTLSRLQRT